MKNKKYILFGLIVVLMALVSSCGQAEFDVSLNIDDTNSVNLGLITTSVTIQVEIPVSGTNFGIDLEKIKYKYTTSTAGTDSAITVGIRLSLHGQSESNVTFRSFTTGDGFQPEYLKAVYDDTIAEINSTDKYGWVSLISPVSITRTTPNSDETIINSSNVINNILKQNTIWIIVDITTSNIAAAGNTFTISDQTIQAIGSKATGYYPGVF